MWFIAHPGWWCHPRQVMMVPTTAHFPQHLPVSPQCTSHIARYSDLQYRAVSPQCTLHIARCTLHIARYSTELFQHLPVSPQCTLRIIAHTAHFPQHLIACTPVTFDNAPASAHSALPIPLNTYNLLQCSAHSSLYVHFPKHPLQSSQHNVQAQGTLQIVHFSHHTLCTAQCAVHSMHTDNTLNTSNHITHSEVE